MRWRLSLRTIVGTHGNAAILWILWTALFSLRRPTRAGILPANGVSSLAARSERSPLRIVIAENEPEGRTEGSGDGEMKYRRATIVADDWHGEFGSYDEWARLGPQPPYRAATFFDAQGRRCITQHDFARARDDRAFPLRYRWERTEPRKRREAQVGSPPSH